jgi:hypothetical protein
MSTLVVKVTTIDEITCGSLECDGEGGAGVGFVNGAADHNERAG